MSANAAIIARIGLDHGGFRKDLQDATKAVEREERAMAAAAKQSAQQRAAAHQMVADKIRGTAGELAAAVGIGFGVAGIVQGGKALIDFASNLQDTSDALGINVEAVQELTFAFGQSGVGAETVNKGLSKLSENLTAAKDGNEKMIESFSKLGVSWDQINKLAPDEVIMAIAASSTEATDPAERLSNIIDVMGKSGRKMAAGINGGVDALRGLRSEAAKLTSDEVKVLDTAGDKISALMNRIKVGAASIIAKPQELIDALAGTKIDTPAAALVDVRDKQAENAARKKATAEETPESTPVDPRKRKEIEDAAKTAIDNLQKQSDLERKNAEAAIDRDREADERQNQRALKRLEIEEQIARIKSDKANELAQFQADGEKRVNDQMNADLGKQFNEKLDELSATPDERRAARRAERKQDSLARRAARELNLEAREGLAKQDFKGNLKTGLDKLKDDPKAQFKQALEECDVLKAIKIAAEGFGKAK